MNHSLLSTLVMLSSSPLRQYLKRLRGLRRASRPPPPVTPRTTPPRPPCSSSELRHDDESSPRDRDRRAPLKVTHPQPPHPMMPAPPPASPFSPPDNTFRGILTIDQHNTDFNSPSLRSYYAYMRKNHHSRSTHCTN